MDVVFVPPVAAYARTRRWPDGLTLTPDSDGAVRLAPAPPPAFLALCRSCCAGGVIVYVLGGSALRAAMTEEVHALAALYSENAADFRFRGRLRRVKF